MSTPIGFEQLYPRPKSGMDLVPIMIQEYRAYLAFGCDSRRGGLVSLFIYIHATTKTKNKFLTFVALVTSQTRTKMDKETARL